MEWKREREKRARRTGIPLCSLAQSAYWEPTRHLESPSPKPWKDRAEWEGDKERPSG